MGYEWKLTRLTFHCIAGFWASVSTPCLMFFDVFTMGQRVRTRVASSGSKRAHGTLRNGLANLLGMPKPGLEVPVQLQIAVHGDREQSGATLRGSTAGDGAVGA